METYYVYTPNSIKKVLKKFPKHWQVVITVKIRELAINPYLGVKMNGNMSHLRKIRISSYRIIYKVVESEIRIEIIEIESRGNMSYDR
jgi:addiction module RelE/StbE family toxin